jgi:uncharacterized damage-inducible protein DinB
MQPVLDRDTLRAAFEAERKALLAVINRLQADQWHSLAREDGWTAHDIVTHLADTNYGLALMAQRKTLPSMSFDSQRGWFDQAQVDQMNQDRREKNKDLPLEKVLSRTEKALDEVAAAIEAVEDLEAESPLDGSISNGTMLRRIVRHMAEHRSELEVLVDCA